MALYLLYESAFGYALFLAHGIDEIGQNTEAVRNSVTDLNRFGKVVKFVAFTPFESALDALNQCNAISEGEERRERKLKPLSLLNTVNNGTISSLRVSFWVCSVFGTWY
ncbi:Nucleolar protein 56 [Camellia lanceoleosa]|uniref:Nucleolar protein 56 n=1 Tax=Camellia lanceoleosa TaxID=1840588 RepID=A0ACC0I4J6_9ERIC|nr:Nucleolar protein 56 [Camellia lanceoleosa]